MQNLLELKKLEFESFKFDVWPLEKFEKNFLPTFCLLGNKYFDRQQSFAQGQPNAIIKFRFDGRQSRKAFKFGRWQQSVIWDVIAQTSRAIETEEVLQSSENELDF